MTAKGEVVQDVVLIEAPDNAGGTIHVNFDQTLFLHFSQDCTFCCTPPESFLPNLPNGQHFTANTLWGPAYADEDYNGTDVNWNTIGYKQDCIGTSSAVTATATANVIRVGSGGSSVSFFDILTKSRTDAAKSVLCENWKSAEALLKFIKKNSKNLAPSNTAAVTSLLADGAKAYKAMKC